MKTLKTVFAIYLVAIFSACTTTAFTERKLVNMPRSWGPLSDSSETSCDSINGIYANKGEWILEESGPILANALLSLSVFLRSLPNAEIPGTVRLSIDENLGQLIVSLIGSQTISHLYSMICDSGVLMVNMDQGSIYLGDGVQQDYLKRSVFFVNSESGDLIINIKSEGKFRSAIFINTKEESESWYRFERVNIQ